MDERNLFDTPRPPFPGYFIGGMPWFSFHPAVHFLTVPHLHHKDEEGFIPDLVNGAVVLPRSHIDAVEFLLRLQFLHPMRTRIFFQAEKVPADLLADVRV